MKNKKTLKDIGRVFNVSINTVYRWEHDLTAPRKSSLKKAAAFYNVPFEWLISDSMSDDEENVQIDRDRTDICIMNIENDTEQKLLKMFRKVSESNKYKILGYLERICVEGMDKS